MKPALKLYAGISLLLLLHSGAGKAQIVNVNQEIQLYNQWCWAACSKCVLDYYGFPGQSQCQIAEYARTMITWHNFGTTNCCIDATQGCNYWNYNWGYPGSIEDILNHYASIKTINLGYPLSITDIQKEGTHKNPFIIRWGWYSGGGHFMIGAGISGNSVHYMNPLPGYGHQVGNYSWMVDDSYDHEWTHSQLFCSPLTSLAGNTVVCPGASATFSITKLADATFNWTFPSGWNGSGLFNNASAIAGQNSGSVTVSYTDRCGSGGSRSIFVKVPAIDTTVTRSGPSLVSTQSQAQYQWVTCPSMQAVTGATNQAFTPNVNGNYAVKVTVDGCEEISSCRLVNITSLASQQVAAPLLTAFPNPAQESLFIAGDGFVQGSCTLSLINTIGQVIYTRQFMLESGRLETTLDLSLIPPGIYQLELQKNGLQARLRIIRNQQ